MASLAAQVTATGISAPDYNTILTSVIAQFQAIYGSDVVLTPDTQDGQFLAIIAQMISDANTATIAVYNGFAPQFAQGVGLSNMVKINGLRRNAPSNSSTPVTITGVAGTTLNGALIGDNLGLNTQWSIPNGTVIGAGGTVSTTATSTTAGAVAAAANSLTVIITPTLGWQSITNPNPASLGAPVETDAQLRQRQAASVANPAQAITAAIYSRVANVAGVTSTTLYENSSSAIDLNNLPAHSISLVVAGGALQDIVNAIGATKPPGVQTYGTTSGTYTDQVGNTSTINYFVLALEAIYVSLTIKSLPGYVSSTGTQIQKALVQYLTTLGTGQKVYYNRLWSAANLSGTAALASSGLTQAQLDALSATYDITALTVGTAPNPVGTADIAVPFNQAATSDTSKIVLTVT